MNPTIIDYPMACCGMMAMQDIYCLSVTTDEDGVNRFTNEKDIAYAFDVMLEKMRKLNRNCGMVVLSENQAREIKVALAKGFEKIFEFYNPNSENFVGIYTKVLAKTIEEGHEMEAAHAEMRHNAMEAGERMREYESYEREQKFIVKFPGVKKETANAV